MSLKQYLMVGAVLLATPVAAHNGAMGIVKERMDGMTAIGAAMKELTALSKTSPIDQEAVAVQAAIIASHSGENMLNRFPAGSLQKASEARESIWENWEKFSAIAFELEAYSESLPTKATPMLLQNELSLTSQTCSACHKSFRLKKE